MRTSYSIKNFITESIYNIINIIFLFIGQTLFIKILGIEYSGVNGLFKNILTILNLFELGISSSITYNLYKYIKYNDKETIKSIMHFYHKAYNYIMLLIFFIGILIIPFIKYMITNITIDVNLYVAYLLFLLSTITTYILAYKRNILIASQKNYIINIIHIIYIIVLNIIQIIILCITKNYYLYLIIKIVFILIENITISIKVNKLYPYIKDKNIKKLNNNIRGSIINRVKALIIHNISGAVTNGTDNILISAFLGITTAGLYTSYDYIITSITKIFGNAISVTSSSIGNLLVENNKDKNYQVFKKINFLNYWIAVFTATCLLILIEPFISIWLGHEYLLPSSVLFILIINYYQTIMRKTYGSFKGAAGIWIEDRYLPILQISINLIFSILLLKLIGLPGVFIGTILSSLVLWLYSYPKYVYKRLFNRNLTEYIINMIKHLIIFVFILVITYFININSKNIVISFIIALTIPNLILYIIYKNTYEFKYYHELLLRILKQSKHIRSIHDKKTN